MKKAVLLLAILLAGACAVSRTPQQPAPLASEDQAKLREASQSLGQEDYLGFKKAFDLYAELSTRPKLRQAVAENYLRAGLLLGVRAKELGIVNPVPLQTVARLIAENRRLAGYQPLLDIAGLISYRGKGVMGDIDTQVAKIEPYYDRPDELKKLTGALVDRWKSDPLAAYLLGAFHCFYPYQEIGLKLEDLVQFYPSSLLLVFVQATCSEEKLDLLQSLLDRESSCVEAYYFLGNAALTRGNLLECEGYYEKAWESIPESPQIAVSLASVAFAVEDFERSIDFYEKTLALLPDYREAILGKAICLTYLGRNAEAIPLLEGLIARGKYLMGESHFWLAWNQHELGRDAEAQENIEQCKKLLGNGQVFDLAGLIALGLKDDSRAQQNFMEALRFNAHDAEALFYLGGILARQQVWEKSGSYYEQAGQADEAQAAALREKLEEINNSALSAERKARLVARKKAQLEKNLSSQALAFYNAAAAYLNAGLSDKALACALKAISHPALKTKAEELMRKIRSSALRSPGP